MKAKLASFVVLVLIGAAIAADSLAPAAPKAAKGIVVATQGGALACPVAVDGASEAFIDIANLSDVTSRVRVTLIPSRGKQQLVSLSVPGTSTRSVRIDGRVRAPASAVVEYVGGEVVASHMLFRRSGAITGIAEAPCARTAGPDLIVLPARTLRATATLSLFNPGSAPADVTVTLVSDGAPLHPERLSRRVVAGRSRLDFSLEDFAFDAQTVSAIVHAITGRVVAEVLQTNASGIEILTATEPATDVVSFSGVSGASARLAILPFGRGGSSIGGSLLSATATASGMRMPEAITPDAGASVPIAIRSKGGPASTSLTLNSGAPFSIGSSWSALGYHGTEIGALPGAHPANRWGAVGALVRAGSMDLLVANPGEREAAVNTIVMVGGAQQRRTVVVEPGSLKVLRLGTKTGFYGVLVTSSQPVVTALHSFCGSEPTGVLVAGIAGTALRTSTPVAPRVDGRAGVPAPLPRP